MRSPTSLIDDDKRKRPSVIAGRTTSSLMLDPMNDCDTSENETEQNDNSSLSSHVSYSDDSMNHNNNNNDDDTVPKSGKRQKQHDTRDCNCCNNHHSVPVVNMEHHYYHSIGTTGSSTGSCCLVSNSCCYDNTATNNSTTTTTTTTGTRVTVPVSTPMDVRTQILSNTIIQNFPHAITPVPSQLTLLSSSSSCSSTAASLVPLVVESIVVSNHTTNITLLPLQLPLNTLNNDTPLQLSQVMIVRTPVSLTKNDVNIDTCCKNHNKISFDNNKPLCQSTISYRKFGRWICYLFLGFSASIVIVVALHRLSYTQRQQQQQQSFTTLKEQSHKHSICVSGGGFSGFWFTLGRLQNSIILPTTQSSNNGNTTSDYNDYENAPKESEKAYYCYSSGCLGVVAALSRYSMEDMWNMAYNIQLQWKSGQLNRYDVVTTFVDDLLFGGGPKNRTKQPTKVRLDPNDLSSLNIITSVMTDGMWGLTPSIRTPQTVEELRTMLIQTTWIPYAIGNALWYDNHMDGAFTTSDHPTCHYNVGLALDWDLYTNVINVNLGRDKVERFWNKGLTYGL